MTEIKITNEAAVLLLSSINNLMKSGVMLPTKVWYTLSKNKRILTPFQVGMKEVTDQLIKKYGEVDPESGLPFMKPGTKELKLFENELGEILGEEETIKLYTVNLSEVLKAQELPGTEGISEFFEYLVVEEEIVE